jgi:mRNA interferase MazF
MNPRRGEIWTADLGMVAKVRPVLILSVATQGDERVLITFVNRTLSGRGTRFEVPHRACFGLQTGVFDCQGIATLPSIKFIRKLGQADHSTITAVEDGVRAWLGL